MIYQKHGFEYINRECAENNNKFSITVHMLLYYYKYTMSSLLFVDINKFKFAIFYEVQKMCDFLCVCQAMLNLLCLILESQAIQNVVFYFHPDDQYYICIYNVHKKIVIGYQIKFCKKV